jgi:hypothetical protein
MGGGVGISKPPPPPKPPTPETAVQNLARMQVLKRQRQAQGYSSTYLTAGIGPADVPQTLAQKILGG